VLLKILVDDSVGILLKTLADDSVGISIGVFKFKKQP